MRYYITNAGRTFTTDHFDASRHFMPGMIAIDSEKDLYYIGGKNWIKMPRR